MHYDNKIQSNGSCDYNRLPIYNTTPIVQITCKWAHVMAGWGHCDSSCCSVTQPLGLWCTDKLRVQSRPLSDSSSIMVPADGGWWSLCLLRLCGLSVLSARSLWCEARAVSSVFVAQIFDLVFSCVEQHKSAMSCFHSHLQTASVKSPAHAHCHNVQNIL